MSTEPGSIHRLDPVVVNRIAAGEVIQRPSNCIKEMLENSIDAKSTHIQIMVKDGGLKSLSISDNGCGIRREDLDIVCERFTTSKLTSFEDLQNISTFGFRGEALASISHVAHVTIVSMTLGSIHAYKATYSDGKLCSKDGGPIEPRPCAGTPGTQIIVDDMFYNYPLRKKALNPSEEYSRIYDVVVRYALHNSGIAFNLKKMGENKSDVSTKKTNSIKDNIRELFGSSLTKDLIEINLDCQNSPTSPFKLSGYISGPTWQSKKSNFILFINNRLVDCAPLKKMLETQYNVSMGKSSHSWMYLDLRIDPRKIDVNMHPTKKEVRLEDESLIFPQIYQYFINQLDHINSEREFRPNANRASISNEEFAYRNTANLSMSNPSNTRSGSANSFAVSPWDVIRTNVSDVSIDSFFEPQRHQYTRSITIEEENNDIERDMIDKSENPEDEENLQISSSQTPHSSQSSKRTAHRYQIELGSDMKEEDMNSNASNPKKRGRESLSLSPNPSSIITSPTRTMVSRNLKKPTPKSRITLQSVSDLIEEARQAQSQTISALFKAAVFVGCASARHCFVQYNKSLVVCDVHNLSKELLYQEILHNLGQFETFNLSEPAPIKALAKLALSSPESNWDPSDGPSDVIARQIQSLLLERAALLNEYFGVQINEQGEIIALPEIIEGYLPTLDGLAMFVFRLFGEVGWIDEKDSIDKISRELARLYATPTEELSNQIDDLEASNSDLKSTSNPKKNLVSDNLAWAIEHQIFPAVRRRFFAPEEFGRNGTVQSVVSTDKLYKIFERC